MFESQTCSYNDCKNLATNRCSKCRVLYYCCREHQQLDWIVHKSNCVKAELQISIDENKINSPGKSNSSEKRECRCMFCGNLLLFSSEEEACQHLRECVELQEQLNSKNEIEIPSSIKSKIKLDK